MAPDIGWESRNLMWRFLLCLFLAGCATPLRGSLVAVPSFTGRLPDGTTVYALIVVPKENIQWEAAGKQWQTKYPTRYEILTRRR